MVAVRNISLPPQAAKRVTLLQITVGNQLRNYNYILHDKQANTTTAIDPTDAEITIAALNQEQLSLDRILCTHHHLDHIGGNEALKLHYNCDIGGYKHDAERIPAIDIAIDDSEQVNLSKRSSIAAHIINVSGHTIGHIAYYLPDIGLLFPGDALFSMGCGRIFEGTAEMAFNSLQKLAALPDETLCCIAHEYTAENGRFAVSLEPDNIHLIVRLQHVKTLSASQLPTVPVALGTEKRTNPFLRVESHAIRNHMGGEQLSDAEIFARLRTHKDTFRAS
jgi:hydroxyacylglutathione hydrolase